MPPSLPLNPAQHIAIALAKCGLAESGFTVKYDDELQRHVIMISAGAGAKSENLSCIWQAVHSELVQFSDSELNAQFQKISDDFYRPQMIDSARKSLARIGLLDRFPQRSQFDSDMDFAKALEAHCGYPAGTVLDFMDGMFTIRPSAFQGPVGSVEFEKLSGLMSALMLATAESETFNIGFIGNQAFSNSEEK